jgi:hypothetical protein
MSGQICIKKWQTLHICGLWEQHKKPKYHLPTTIRWVIFPKIFPLSPNIWCLPFWHQFWPLILFKIWKIKYVLKIHYVINHIIIDFSMFFYIFNILSGQWREGGPWKNKSIFGSIAWRRIELLEWSLVGEFESLVEGVNRRSRFC